MNTLELQPGRVSNEIDPPSLRGAANFTNTAKLPGNATRLRQLLDELQDTGLRFGQPGSVKLLPVAWSQRRFTVRLARLIVIAAVSLSLVFPQPRVQGANFGVNAWIQSGVGYAHGGTPPEPPADWPARFLPSSPNGMPLESVSGGGFWDVGLTLEPSVVLESRNGVEWEIGLPVFYDFGVISFRELAGLERTVSATDVVWWDRVSLTSLSLKKDTPGVGLSLRRNFWRLQYSVQHYQIQANDYEGFDCVGCGNTSSVFRSRDLEDGFAHKVELGYQFGEVPVRIAGFYEHVTSQVWMAGITLSLRVHRFFER